MTSMDVCTSLSEIEQKLDGIFLEYFSWYLQAKAKYERFVILMQVGDFYEMYGYNLKNFKIGNIDELHHILDINITRKNTNKPPNYGNPNMSGFPIRALDKFISILKENQYVIYHIIQEDIPGKIEKKRVLNQIISPGTDVNTEQPDNLFLFSLYLEEQSGLKIGGLTYSDLSTGKCYANHFVDTKTDKDYMFNQITRIFRST